MATILHISVIIPYIIWYNSCMSGQWYEIYLSKPNLEASSWGQFFTALKRYIGWRAHWSIRIELTRNTLHYYLESPLPLPSSLGVGDFLLKALPKAPGKNSRLVTPKLPFRLGPKPCELPQLLYRLEKRNCDFVSIDCSFSACGEACITTNAITFKKAGKLHVRSLAFISPAELCSVNFSKNQHLRYKKIPTYLDSEKVQRLASSGLDQPLLLLDNFPYEEGDQGLDLLGFDFAKHSLVLGSSGAGKSRFLCLLIAQIYKKAKQDYKIVVIDPHDALKNNLGEVLDQEIIDFRSTERSVDLFRQDVENLNVSVELMLSTFRSLIGEGYNGRLERVLRHTIYLLLLDQSFDFSTLRRVLSETEYRNETLTRLKSQLPLSVSRFFLTEFQELKSGSYDLAFAPIMAFIDEMQMLSVFNSAGTKSVAEVMEHHFLSIFSLSRLQLGDKVTQTIAGLLMQQLFLVAERRRFSEHLIIIIDEVAVIENPILVRFLSEMRKFGVSVILAGQYFAQVSSGLRTAILANASNYYIFRIARGDARTLVDNLQIKSPKLHDSEDMAKLFVGLKARECLVQISRQGELYPVFKAQTPDYNPPENPLVKQFDDEITTSTARQRSKKIQLLFDTNITVETLMFENTTNRKKLSKEQNV